ncbi:uncharacterized protein LOC125067084 [Vanessa atalanta]|uniref:uncharacterized protein LOC125067084 n=1 Tax=Vanessa atalanta TaxID=42275 RepID=UPI001FCE1885|nr:uncharacterized protein LOC125067084 [Vanessa atalanta]
MGCGSSGHVVAPAESAHGNGKAVNGNGTNANDANDHHNDDLPTVILPETPTKPKPPVAYEIPIEEFDGNKRTSTPPAHLQRLLQPPSADISLPDIKEKLAEAEQRRLTILQQRAASAQKRAQKMMKSHKDSLAEEKKLGSNVLTISPEPGICEDKNI